MSYDRKWLDARKHLGRHLAELGGLFGRSVGPEELITLEETEDIRLRSKEIALSPTWRRSIRFEDRRADPVVDLVQRLHQSRSLPVYVWTALSNLCGLARPIPLAQFNLAFDFNVNREGIVALVTSDLLDKLIFDFSVQNGRRELEIEVSGDHWGRVEPLQMLGTW